ncbi:NTP transferase domain-containing protein [Neoaquamicrobium sediminum]|uniref:NTP transferase domain-containing protein n=1 Tax=Neoaquamicrobium sediminum TaxID=1849104 RepID=UPI001563C7C6|nr:molybdopterin-binding/glycosyltransferase family 2 protein [Mesorhizobium sediminum]NRC55198.1 NTP transferase domain-containing protein [Mesorhizobium sediminum]
MKFGPVSIDEAEGAVLAHSVAVEGRSWRKATVLGADDVAAMKAAGLNEVIAAVLEPGDLDENAAATQIADGLAAPGIEVRRAATGRVNLHAEKAGLFVVDRAAVDAINAVDPAITLATLAEFAPVSAGQMLATVKIIPFAVARTLVERAADIAGCGGVIGLHGFEPRYVGLVQTVLPSVKTSVLEKTARLTAERLARSGSIIVRETRTRHEDKEVAEAITALKGEADMVIVFGASAVSDPDDVIPAAIRGAGGFVSRVGMPVDPGNLLVLGELDGRPIVGAPGCARSPKLNGFDWVLDRIVAGLPIGDREIAGMGVGGLLMEIETRPQPREPRPSRKAVVDAVLLAAGRGQRMGGPNKLLSRISGQPLVRHAAQALLDSGVRSVVVVTGHEGDRVRAALGSFDVRMVDNAGYASGLASSLKTGIAALPQDAAGALVALGDMPEVTSAHIDMLLKAFVREHGNAIIRATHAGKRGNPVILPRSLFAAVATLEGDTGARQIVESSELPVIDVEIGAAASLDIDTPEALALAGGEPAD